MEKFNKIKTMVLTVDGNKVVAASPDVLTNQRRLGRRHTLEIYNDSDIAVLFGGEDVTLESGMPILPNESRMFPVDDPEAIYLIAEKPADVVIAEYCV